jgi:hypothetical protein
MGKLCRPSEGLRVVRSARFAAKIAAAKSPIFMIESAFAPALTSAIGPLQTQIFALSNADFLRATVDLACSAHRQTVRGLLPLFSSQEQSACGRTWRGRESSKRAKAR